MRTEVLLRFANGYRILEMFEDAECELLKIPEGERMDDGSLAMQVALYQDWGKWGKMREAARLLRQRHPDDADWWVAEAYATRRSISIEDAQIVLQEGVDLHPETPCLHYNLGCYACVLGNQEEALKRVRSAIAFDPKYQNIALQDEDLKDLRSELS